MANLATPDLASLQAPAAHLRQLDREAVPGSPVDGAELDQGQAFVDLVFLAAMACQAPMSVISVVQPDGSWSTLSYGLDRRELPGDAELFATVANGPQPLELTVGAGDGRLATSPFTKGPQGARYLYGIPLRGPEEATLGVLCVLDRRTRALTRREQQAITAVARQITEHLVRWRRARKSLACSDQGDRGDQGEEPAPCGERDATAVGPATGRQGNAPTDADPRLLRSQDVAVLFDVSGRTVVNWASSRKLASLRTVGGHLRFRPEDVHALLALRSRRFDSNGSPGGT